MRAQELITQHLDIWAAAHKTRSGVGRGSSNKLDLYGIKKLRELILALAVRGKLVPQDPNDEPAGELLKRIAAGKSKLFKEGKIKKENPLPEIAEEEKPFELPNGWVFTRLGDLVEMFNGRAFKSTEWSGQGLPIIRIQNLNDPEAGHNYFDGHVDPKNLVENGTFLISWSGTPGTSFGAFIWQRGLAALNQHINKCEFHFQDTNLEFMKLAVNGQMNNFIAKAQGGVGLKHVTKGTLNEAIIALPCLDEQHRIVAKVDELMAFCDQLEQIQGDNIAAHAQLVEALLAILTNSSNHNELQNNWQRIAAHFDTLFTTEHSIDQLKQAILQLAVMGKLVPQDPNDEPASELLKNIAAEKAQLIKDGKIKKETPLPKIKDEEKPFELPSGWEWCRLPDIGELARGKSKHRPRNDPKLFADGTIPLIQTGDVARSEKTIQTYSALYNDFGLAQSRLWPKGTMCITIAANIADTGLLGFEACFPDSVVGFLQYDKNIPVEYFEYFIKVTKDHLEKFAPSTAQKNINLEILGDLLVPCPPANELNRIVTKVDELMSLCDNLKTNLQNVQTTQLALADSLVESMTGVSHSSSSPVINEELSMEIITPIELSPNIQLKSDAVLAKMINTDDGSIDAKRLWQKSNMDLPNFYKQLKREISAGYILKPTPAKIK